MAKYTEEDYVSKLLPESLARMILFDDLKGSEYSELLRQLWLDSREFLLDYKTEKEFILSVMSQIDFFCNVQDYCQDLEFINANAVSETGKFQIDFTKGSLFNDRFTRLYCYICNKSKLIVRELFDRLLYPGPTALALWYVDKVCNNFGIEITQNGKPVDLKKAKMDSVVEICRKSNK